MKANSTHSCMAGFFFLACFFTSTAAFSQVQTNSTVNGSALLADKHTITNVTEIENLLNVVTAGHMTSTAEQLKKLRPSNINNLATQVNCYRPLITTF